MATSKRDQILRLFNGMEIVRPSDAEAIGIAGSCLNSLHNKGGSNDLELRLNSLFCVMYFRSHFNSLIRIELQQLYCCDANWRNATNEVLFEFKMLVPFVLPWVE
jgi:hypothetical protein